MSIESRAFQGYASVWGYSSEQKLLKFLRLVGLHSEACVGRLGEGA